MPITGTVEIAGRVVAKSPYLCTAIAWISVGVVVAAGVGACLQIDSHSILLQTGVVCLVAALGLSKAERYRRTVVLERKFQADAEIVEQRLNANVSAIVPKEDAPLVIDRIMDECAERTDLPIDRRSRARSLTSRRLITITTCDPSENWHTVSGCLKDISAYGMGFVHQEPLPSGPAVATFVLNNQQMSLEIDLRWSQQISKKWFCSGGFFLGSRQTQQTINEISDQYLDADLAEVWNLR